MVASAKDSKNFVIIRNRMYSALNAYFIWKIINQSINVHSEGGEKMANENLELVINKYKYFFQQILNSSYKTFIVDLAIFFDSAKYEESLSLRKLFNILEINDTAAIKIINEIEEIKKPHGELIDLILKLRNQDVAHQGINPEQHVLNYEKVEALFKAIQEILNKLTKYYDDSISIWSHVERDMLKDIKWIFDNLKRGERLRLEEINKKWHIPQK
jgi:hypothetical protein